MILVERTVSVPRPVESVFDYLSDFTHAEQWDAGTISCVRESGDGGEGTVYRNTSKFLGRSTTLMYVVEGVEPPRIYRIRGSNATVTSTDTITVRPATPGPGGSAVTYRAEFEFEGLARRFEWLLRAPIRRLADRTEQRLSEALARLPEQRRR